MSASIVGTLLQVAAVAAPAAAADPAPNPSTRVPYPTAVGRAVSGGQIVFDEALHSPVLVGTTADTLSPATGVWVWTGAQWTPRPSLNNPFLYGVAAAYDGEHQQVVAFGQKLNDPATWTWDGLTWTEQHPLSSPPAIRNAAMTYDPLNHRVVLFGGHDGYGVKHDETWLWDGTNWTQASPATVPPGRTGAGFAWDGVRGNALLFGGQGTSGTLDDTWSWNGTNWTAVSPEVSPGPRSQPGMAYDNLIANPNGRIVLFGGRDGATDLTDTWTWNGTNWHQEAPVVSPPPASRYSYEYDYEGLGFSGVAGSVLGFKQVAGTAAVPPSGQTWGYTSRQALTGDLTDPLVRPDAVSAQITARVAGRRVEIAADRTETTTTYVNPDGTYTQDAFAVPIRVLRDGVWTTVDTTLVKEGGSVHPKAVSGDVRFSAGGTGPAAQLTANGHSLALNWPTALPEPVLVGSSATYPNVATDTDLILEATPTGFEQFIRLRKAPATPPVYDMPVTLTGWNLTQTLTGELQLTDSTSGDLVANGPAARMWGTGTDLNSDEPLKSAAVPTSVVSVAGTTHLRLAPSAAFLADPTLVYPVTIDPPLNLTRSADTFVDTDYSSNQSGATQLRSGTWTSGQAARSLLTFNTSGLTGKHVLSASMALWNFHSYSCTARTVNVHQITSAWSPSAVTWTSGQPSIASTPAATQNVSHGYSGCGSDWIYWDLHTLVQNWANGTANYGVEVRSSESDVLGWKKFCSGETGTTDCASSAYAPKLSTTYNSYPKLPTSPLPATGSYTNDNTPSLSAVVSDPDGGTVKGVFYVQTSGGTWVANGGNGSSVSSGGRSTYTLGTRADGTYQWRVRASDGTDAGATAPSSTTWYTFTVDTVNPSPPAVSSSQFPENGWTTGTTGSFTWTAGSADATTWLWGIDTPTPTTVATSRNTNQLTVAPGSHTFYVRGKDRAGNLSAVTAYKFGVGTGVVTSPADQDRTQATVSLTSTAPAAKTHVAYYYRVGSTGSFSQVPVADVTVPGTTTHPAWPVARGGNGEFPALTWAAATTAGADGLVQVEACFYVSATDTAPVCSPWNNVTVARHAFGASYATESMGPGQVSLLTGDYAVTANDVSVPSYRGSLSLGRTLTSLTPTGTGIFGPGWVSDLPGPESGASEFTVDDHSSAGFVNLVGPDGETLVYALSSGSTYLGIGDASGDGSVLTKDSSTQFTLTDDGGTATVWKYKTFTGAASKWVVDHVSEAGNSSTSTYTFDPASGRVTRILAPVPSDVASCTSLVAGCRALDITYGTSTTATGTTAGTWGDFLGQVKSVTFTTWDQNAGALSTVPVAAYRYDSTGRLRQEWDPRNVTALGAELATTYAYDAAGRLASVTPAGQAAWSFTYDAGGRLVEVSRPDGVQTQRQTIVYGVPFTGDASLPDIGAAAAATWAQQDLPVTATAVYKADHVPAVTPLATDYPYATVHYLDVNGREVNTASYGAGAWQVSTTEFDAHGNVVRTLSAGNRAEALAPTDATEPSVANLADSSARAAALDTHNVYSADGTVLVDTYGPTHLVLTDDGTPVVARAYTHTDYDEGAPAGGPYHLPTTVTTTARVTTETSVTDYDARVTTSGYDPIVTGDGSGWTLRQPTSKHTVLGGNTPDIVQITRYNAAGQLIESRMPKAAGGTDAHTETTTYYTGTANTTYPACGNKAAWSGLVCRIGRAGAPASGRDLPISTYTYDTWNRPLTLTETVGATTRTATTVYDAAGRTSQTSLVVSPASDGGTALPNVTFTYWPDTGFPKETTAGGVSTVTQYDALGRITTYTDADGNATTTTYDLVNRPVTIADGKGTTTYTYDSATEHRGLVTALDAGLTDGTNDTFSATYDADGALVAQTYPNGLVATSTYDANGGLRSLSYDAGTVNWMTFDQVSNVFGEIRESDGPGSNQTYGYDAASRLVSVEDADSTSGDTVCKTRVYGYDADSNRTTLRTYADAGSGVCSTSTASTLVTRTYDDADRLVDTGYSYDAFGRTTAVPAVDAGGTALTVGYYANDMVASQTQGSRTMSWTLDPARRLRAYTDSSTGLTRTNHYGGSGDSPLWIGASDGTWSRNVTGVDGTLALIQPSAGGADLQLANPHGDVVAVTPAGGAAGDPTAANAAISSYVESTEFGTPRATNTRSPRYGWLGNKQRSADSLGGIVLMGVRLYSSAIGRFLQKDPVPGGSANAYDYANQDPINKFDLDGRWWHFHKPHLGNFFRTVVNVAKAASPWIGAAAFGACIIATSGLCGAVGWAAVGVSAVARLGGCYYRRCSARQWAWAGVQTGLDIALQKLPGSDEAVFSHVKYGGKAYRYRQAVRTSYLRNHAIGSAVGRGIRQTSAYVFSRLYD